MSRCLSPLRILVVDDHHDTTNVLSRLLKLVGHSVSSAEGFHAAIDRVKAERFEVLLCDIGLKDGDGCELLAQVLAMYPVKSIALTGYGTPEDLVRFERAGFNGFLLKPVDFLKLQETVEAIAEGRLSFKECCGRLTT